MVLRMGRGLGDGALIEKAVLLMEELGEDAASRWRFEGMRAYEFEKLVCGLVDLYRNAAA